jgi:hypothetical protein
MEKSRQNQETSLTNAYSLFVYAIRTQITKDYYLRRLRSFFDYIKSLPNANIQLRCNQFAAVAIKDPKWTFGTKVNHNIGRFWDEIIKEINRIAKEKKLDIRYTSLFELHKISIDSRESLDKLKEEVLNEKRRV